MNVLLHNDPVVYRYATGETDEYASPVSSSHLAQQYTGLYALFQKFGKSNKAPMFDRTGTLPHFLRMENVSPLRWTTYSSYEQICELQADRFKSMNQRIVVYWSGGTDSTLIICSLLKAGVKPDQMLVVLNQTSIDEYEWFFLHVIHPKVPYALSNHRHPFRYNVIQEDDVVTTGELAEALLHPGRVTQIMEDCDYRLIVPESVQEFVDPLLKVCPKQIDTLYDFSWWIRFTMFWQPFKCALWTFLPRKPQVRHFFDCSEFESWSVEHYRREWWPTPNPRDFKPYNKKIITDFTGDQDYWMKPKIPSLLYDRKSWSYLLEDYTLIGEGNEVI